MSPTPILDLEQAPPQSATSYAPIIVGFTIGLVAVILRLDTLNLFPHWHWPGLNFLLFLPAIYLILAVHELGHLAAALLAGLEFGGLSIGVFVIVKSGDHWTLRIEWSRWLSGFLVPRTPPRGCRLSQLAWCLAGGPLASLGLAVLAWSLWTTLGDGAWNWAGTLLNLSAMMALLSVIPTTSGLQKSDAARLWQLLWDPKAARRWMALVAVQSEDSRGAHPRDWTTETFAELLSGPESENLYVVAQLLAYYRRLDEGNDAAAVGHLENSLRASASAEKRIRHALYQEAAWASAHIRRRAAQAREWRDRACRVQTPRSLHAVDAAIAWCEERYEVAEKEWQAARVYLDGQKVDSGLCRFAKQRWQRFEQECRDARTTSAPSAEGA